MHFLKARTLIKLEDLKGADGAIVEAIALDNDNAQYFNALGYVNSLKGRHERALAAYRMTLDRDPANGFAYYNIGVTLLNQGDLKNAADAFYGAGLGYLKTSDYGQAEKAIVDLKSLAAEGVELAEEIQALEAAMKKLLKEGETNV
jgi:tetratricopeptide (TPR) repeat protein